MKIVNRAVKTSCLFAAGWCLSVLATPAAQAGVLDQVPSDALVVMKINHLGQTNTKVANLLQTLGVTDLVPTMKDPLGALESQAGMGAGIDTKGDAAAVVLKGDFEQNGPPPFVLLLPVSDYKAFVNSMTLVRTEGDVSVVHFKDNEEDAFVENWGDYAAISDKKANVTGPHAGLKTKGLSAKELDARDLCIYVNFPELKALLLPKLKEGSENVIQEMARHPKEMDPAKLKLAQVALRQGVNVLTEFLNDADGTTIGMTITPEGISTNMVVEFTPDSYLGKLAASMKNTDQPLLSGLPKENYLFFGGSVEDGKVIGQVISDVLDPILKELSSMNADGKKLADTIEASKASLSSTDGGAIGIVAPTAALGQGSLFRFLAVYKGDAQAVKDAQSRSADVEADMMKLFGIQQMDLMKTTITPNFKTVGSIKFDRIQAEVNPDNTSQEAMQVSQMISQVYGPDGISVLSGVVDPKTLLVGMGIDDDLLGQAIDAAKSNKDVLTDELQIVDAGLPKKRAAVAYLGLDQIVTTALSYAKANGANLPIQLPNNLPPIGMSAGTDGSAMRFDSYTPTKLLQSMVQAGMQAYLQFNNHGGGGGGL